MENNNNLLIVLIPHFNDLAGLETSLRSISEEISVDVIIVDDGSKEKPNLIELRKFYKNGAIYLEIQQENQGIEYALNTGLRKIKELGYPYIGRLDCGDTCLPNRFKTQLNYLFKHPLVKLLGTQVNYINDKGKLMYSSKFPTTYRKIKKQFYINSMIVHPSVVFSSSLLDDMGYYPTNYHAAEDYAYFMKIIQKYETRNLSEVYVEKVIDNKSISTIKWKLQVRNRIRVIWDNFYFGWYPIYGLIRNCILYLFPKKLVEKIKLILSGS